MRKDFGRVVIERARRGSACPSLKMRKTGRFKLEAADWNEWDYDGPLKIRTNGIRGVKHTYDRSMGEKDFTDVLGPLNGYLRNSVGRQWNDVHSELCATLGGGGYAIRHVLTQHALREVCCNTYVQDGKVYAHPERFSYGDYFVDPRDGTLREEKKVHHRYKRPALDRHHRKNGLWFVRVNGIWFLGSYTRNPALASIASRPEPESRITRRRWLTQVEERDRLWPNVDGWYFVKWKQAGKKDLRELRKLQQSS